MAYELGLSELAQQAGVSAWMLVVLILWTAFWKLFGLWKSARNNHIVWFIVIALVNTVGILPIIYIFGISRMNFEQEEGESSRKEKGSKKKSN